MYTTYLYSWAISCNTKLTEQIAWMWPATLAIPANYVILLYLIIACGCAGLICDFCLLHGYPWKGPTYIYLKQQNFP